MTYIWNGVEFSRINPPRINGEYNQVQLSFKCRQTMCCGSNKNSSWDTSVSGQTETYLMGIKFGSGDCSELLVIMKNIFSSCDI